MNKQTPEFGEWSWKRLGDRGCDGYGRQRKEELLDCAEHFTKFGEEKAAKEIEALKAERDVLIAQAAKDRLYQKELRSEIDRLKKVALIAERLTCQAVVGHLTRCTCSKCKDFLTVSAALNHKEG